MMVSESPRVSSLPSVVNQNEIPAIGTWGEYTAYPLEVISEDQAAKLFSKICQRGNPVLQGRPAADLVVLGRAMYRKAILMRLGQVFLHNSNEPVALGFSWDVAEGGVWQDSGLEMPASLAAHAACGKAAFDSLQIHKRSDKNYFGGFFGVLPPHNGQLFGIMAVCSFMMAHELGFQDGFQYTLLPTLNKRGGVFGKFGEDADNLNLHLPFAEIDADKAVAEELAEMAGTVNVSLTNLDYAILGDEWMARCAATIKLKTAEEMRRPSALMCANHLQWLKQIQSTSMITSRL
jgi:hypothetical protein